MRKILVVFFLFALNFLSTRCTAQSYDQAVEKFWTALQNGDQNEIASNGIVIIERMEKDKFPFDSTVVEIRVYTAMSLDRLGSYSSSLAINLKTQSLIEKYWGRDNFFYGAVVNNISLNSSGCSIIAA